MVWAFLPCFLSCCPSQYKMIVSVFIFVIFSLLARLTASKQTVFLNEDGTDEVHIKSALALFPEIKSNRFNL